MFNKIQKNIFKLSQILTLILYVQVSESFTLDSKSLLKKQDFFSVQKKNEKFDKIDSFLTACSENSEEGCLEKGRSLLLNSKYANFKKMITKQLVDYILKNQLNLELIESFDITLVDEKQKKMILKHHSYKDLKKIFPAVFLEDLMTKQPNLLCKFSNDEVLLKNTFNKIKKDKELFQKDFSDFPCELNLNKHLPSLALEIKNKNSKKPYNFEYSFEYIRKELGKTAYRYFPRYKKSTFVERSKKQWKRILDYPDYAQNRIVKNLFYKGKYKMLSRFRLLNNKQKAKLSGGALIFIIKSLVAEGLYDDLVFISGSVKRKSKKHLQEISLLKASSLLRTQKIKEAEDELLKALDFKGDLNLSIYYWLWIAQNKLNKKAESKKTARHILKLYPFTYYGLLVGRAIEGESFFSKYRQKKVFKSNFSKTLTSADVERLRFFYTYRYPDKFKKTFFLIQNKMKPVQKALFSLVLNNLGHQIEVIRSLNNIWDEDKAVRMRPFVNASFPFTYEAETTALSKSLKWVSPFLVHAVIRQESAFAVTAQSSSNARGLMQLLPSTAREVARRAKVSKYKSKKDLFKPKVNITLGAHYINRLINSSNGYLPYAFASYNAGPGRMYRWASLRKEVLGLRKGLTNKVFDPIDDLWIEELPWSETRFYTKALLRNMGIYLALNKKDETFSCSPFWVCHKKL